MPPLVSSTRDPRAAPATCQIGVLALVEQPRAQLLTACLVVGSYLVVGLRPSVPQGPQWSGPPFVASSPVLTSTFSGSVHGMFTSQFITHKAGTARVVAETNTACTFQVPSSPPCLFQVSTTTLVVRVVALPPSLA